MYRQSDGQIIVLQRPTNNDRRAWREYWRQLGWQWRCEPEIDEERKKYLSKQAQTMSTTTPFKDIKLSRADVEWLLVKNIDKRSGIRLAESRWMSDRLNWQGVDLRNVNLSSLPLSIADLNGAHLEGADLSRSELWEADLREVFFDAATKLNDVNLGGYYHRAAQLADVHWGDVNLAVVDWRGIAILGDDPTYHRIPRTLIVDHLSQYEQAVRAYRQLATVLRNQGLNEDAARFAYRAQLMHRKLLWGYYNISQYLFSLFLDLLSGYGYKPLRSFIAYLIVIAIFAITYFTIGQYDGPALSPIGSLVFSMTSFHGRGFFPGGITLDDPLTVLAAFEAFVGLLIEVTFIATLTQRLFGK